MTTADETVRWPLVHRRDIGTLYAVALEHGAPANSYNGSGVDSVPVGVIARAMARRRRGAGAIDSQRR